MDDRLLVVKLVAWLEKHLVDSPKSRDLTSFSGYSENRLRQKFYNVTGETPSSYLRKRRLTEAAKEVMGGQQIIDVALKYGYSSQDNFTTAFKSWFGVNPGELQTMDRKYSRFISRLKEPLNIMEIANLNQSPFNSTLMGCIKGAADYFDLDYSAPMLYGLSGHAFLVNIHEQLCPSGPYVWNHDRFFDRLRKLGVRKAGEIILRKGAGAAEIQEANDRLTAHLKEGNLCLLDYLEHQLISGYDEKGFLFLKPWGGTTSVELPYLSFASWDECLGKEGWAQFTLLEKGPGTEDPLGELRESLRLAIEMHRRPQEMQIEGYFMGQAAWTAWIKAIEGGAGSSHGHWWNGMVWGECRSMASEFFKEIGSMVQKAKSRSLCERLSTLYRQSAELILKAKEKDLPAGEQIKALRGASRIEAECQPELEELLAGV